MLPLDGCRRNWDKHLPDGIARLVVDAPAGAMGDDLKDFLDRADAVVVPVLPSAIDIEATVPFLDSLVTHPRVKKGKLPVGLVGNRLKPWTSASQQAMEQLKAWPYPLVAQLRDTQAYVLLAGLGKSVFDYHSEQVRSHQEDWAPLLRWLKKPQVRTMRVPLMGVVQRLQSSRMASQLAFMMISQIREVAIAEYQTKRAEIGWILDDNQGMKAIADAIGSTVNREYAIYERSLAS